MFVIYMKSLVEDISELEGVRSVRKVGEGQFKIKHYSREVKGSDLVRIRGDLRSISQKISNKLDSLDVLDGWEWTEKPSKKYTENNINSITDNKSKGYKPGYYIITVR